MDSGGPSQPKKPRPSAPQSPPRKPPQYTAPSPPRQPGFSGTARAQPTQGAPGERVVHINPSLHFLVGDPLQFTISVNRQEFNYRGETLPMDSMRTLSGRNWLDDRVVNAFLGILVDTTNRGDSGHIFLITSYIPVQWERGDFQSHLYEKVKLSAFDWIFVPVNVNRAHWVLLVADVRNHTVTVLDSMPGGNTQQYVDYWRSFFRQRSMKMGTPEVEWAAGQMQSIRQEDGHNCGVFVLMNAMALAKGVDIGLLHPDHARHFRDYVLCQLHHHAKTREERLNHCEVPGCQRVGRTQRCCVVCGRWAHKECCPSMATGGSYVCVICEATYGV